MIQCKKILINFEDEKMTIICDGCNVNKPWEHRCHEENAYVGGEKTNKPCECAECKELRDMLQKDSVKH